MWHPLDACWLRHSPAHIPLKGTLQQQASSWTVEAAMEPCPSRRLD